MHSFPPAFCVRAKPNTEPSQSSASNPIGTEKRHSVRVSCAGPRAGGGRRTGHDRRAPVEDRSRVAGEGLHDCRPSGFLPFSIRSTASTAALYWILDSLERSGGSRCYPILEAPEGSVDCVHQFRRPLVDRIRSSYPPMFSAKCQPSVAPQREWHRRHLDYGEAQSFQDFLFCRSLRLIWNVLHAGLAGSPWISV
jgi:hypothetical protein